LAGPDCGKKSLGERLVDLQKKSLGERLVDLQV
jgi:hypothetical protein